MKELPSRAEAADGAPEAQTTRTNSGPSPQAARTNPEARASTADPPPPAGFVMPKIFGDDPPRPGPFERSSLWIVTVADTAGASAAGSVGAGGAAGSVHARRTLRHDVPADTLQYPELREVLRVLFAGPAPGDATTLPTPTTPEYLRIEWREHGKTIAVSRLFNDGTLTRDQDGATSVDRRLSADALQELTLAMERAGLHTAGRRFSAPPATP